jgi:hypothetical protein
LLRFLDYGRAEEAEAPAEFAGFEEKGGEEGEGGDGRQDEDHAEIGRAIVWR